MGFLCVYRPPGITDAVDLRLVDLLSAFLDMNFVNNVIIGDFNMPSVNWKTLTAPARFTPFLQICTNYYLKQNVNVATRPSSEAILDLIFTTIGTNICSISIDETFGSSDHSVITFLY